MPDISPTDRFLAPTESYLPPTGTSLTEVVPPRVSHLRLVPAAPTKAELQYDGATRATRVEVEHPYDQVKKEYVVTMRAPIKVDWDQPPSIDTIIETARTYMDTANGLNDGRFQVSKRQALFRVLELFVGETTDEIIENRRRLAGEPPVVDIGSFYHDMQDQAQEPVHSHETHITYTQKNTNRNIATWLNVHTSGQARRESAYLHADTDTLLREAASRTIIARWNAQDEMLRDEDAKRGKKRVPLAEVKLLHSNYDELVRDDPSRYTLELVPNPTKVKQLLPNALVEKVDDIISTEEATEIFAQRKFVPDSRVVVVMHALLQDAGAREGINTKPFPGIVGTTRDALDSIISDKTSK